MSKILIFTFIGLLLLLGGVFFAYLGLTGINDGQAWFLLPATLLLAGAGFVLFRAGKSDASVLFKGKLKLDSLAGESNKPGLEATLKRNNAFDADWGKTNDARNRLKMMQVAADAGKKSS